MSREYPQEFFQLFGKGEKIYTKQKCSTMFSERDIIYNFPFLAALIIVTERKWVCLAQDTLTFHRKFYVRVFFWCENWAPWYSPKPSSFSHYHGKCARIGERRENFLISQLSVCPGVGREKGVGKMTKPWDVFKFLHKSTFCWHGKTFSLLEYTQTLWTVWDVLWGGWHQKVL